MRTRGTTVYVHWKTKALSRHQMWPPWGRRDGRRRNSKRRDGRPVTARSGKEWCCCCCCCYSCCCCGRLPPPLLPLQLCNVQLFSAITYGVISKTNYNENKLIAMTSHDIWRMHNISEISCDSSQVSSLYISVSAQSDRRAISIDSIIRPYVCFVISTYAAEQNTSRFHSLSYHIVPNRRAVRQWDGLGAGLLISQTWTERDHPLVGF